MTRPLLLLLFAVGSARAGLTVTFTRDGQTDSRTDRFPALSIAAGQPVTPFLSAGPFEAVWSGKLVVPRRQRLIFSFEGEGSASLTINGNELLSRAGDLAGESSEMLRLNPGEHEFVLAYRSHDEGSAKLRVYWEELSFPRQTIPSSAFAGEPTPAAILGGQQRHGRVLFTEHHCMKCHAPETGLGTNPMPETAEIGPLLFGIGDRVNEEWLRRWIAEPHTLRPGTPMPDLVDVSTGEGRQQAADLAAYFAASTMGAAMPSAPGPELAQAGGAHFHELGCAACHTPPDHNQPDLETKRVPLNNVASKYQPGALVAFLKKPDQFHAHTGMPDFMMSEEEANSIAAYLTTASEGKHTQIEITFPAGDAARGEEVAKAMNCGVCHPGVPLSGQQAGPGLDTIFKADWARQGCASPPGDHSNGLPVMNLGEEERAALVEFSKTGTDSLRRDDPAEHARRKIEALRCTSCHALDDQRALVDLVGGDTRALIAHIEGYEERVDQTRPRLTFTGEMLYSSYIESMLAGTVEPRPRPWLGMRMPAFRAFAKPLAEGISRVHGYEPSAPTKLEPDPALVETGRLLAGAEGFGCTTCHGVGDQEPTAAFEVMGTNFSIVSDRLREGFYHRWMDNPQSVTPGSKMPRYSENNQSQRADILDGDAAKQFEAIWHYLHSVAE